MTGLKVLIVDDSAAMRLAVRKALERDPAIGAVFEARDGVAALAMVDEVRPDAVVLDVEMPHMDGLETLGELRRSHRHLPVIMFSSMTRRGGVTTLDALALGASDYVTKPSLTGPELAMTAIRTELVPRIVALAAAARPDRAPATPVARTQAPAPRRTWAGPPKAILIASSTGGPPALASLLTSLPRTLGVPILIVQHMPPLFTAMLASRLRTQSGHDVAEAHDGALLGGDKVWVAPGGFHLSIAREAGATVLRLDQTPPVSSLRPAADVLFRSAAAALGAGVMAVVLTGMGTDGAAGCAHVRAAGGFVIAQDEATSVVWGMPGQVCRDGLADVIAPLSRIGDEILARTPVSARRRVAVSGVR